ncbi:MAG: class I SAM-dependent methyltransferase [Gammaproteobacteria bacterium]
MSSKTTFLNEELYKYLQAISVRENPVLQELRIETALLPTSVMQISPEQGQFMAFMVRLMHVKKGIEIGVYTGYSALAVALALPDEAQLIACDINDEWTKMASTYWKKAGVEHKIDLRLAPVLETLDQLLETNQENTFDYAFIDADKNNYDQYYEKCLQLLRTGGVIFIDNVLWGGDVINKDDHSASTESFRKLNLKLLKDDRIYLSMLPIGDGLTLAQKK